MNEALPSSLLRFGDALERAIENELRGAPIRRRPGRLTLKLALVPVAAGLAAFAIVSSLASRAVPSAWASQVLGRAASVLVRSDSPRTILHIALTETLTPLAVKGSASNVAMFTEDGWLQQGPPYRQRVLVRPDEGHVYETGSTPGIYDVTANVLHVGPRFPVGSPRYTVLPGPRAGTFRVRVKLPHGYDTVTESAGTVRALRSGADQLGVAIGWNGHSQQTFPIITPKSRRTESAQQVQPNASSALFATQLRAVLASGHARVTGPTTIDGHSAIEIVAPHPSSGPAMTYYVDPHTYAPVELDIYGFDSVKDLTRIRFRAYQAIPLAGHAKLLRFTLPANARVDRKAADYWRAEAIATAYL